MMYYFRESPLFAKLYAFDTMNRTILMKHYELKSLKKLLKNRKITYHRTLFVPLLKDVSMALREMHLRYMVHRDIKVTMFLKTLYLELISLYIAG